MADWNDALVAMQQRLDALDRQMAQLEKRKSHNVPNCSAQPVFPVTFPSQCHNHHKTSSNATNRPIRQESPPALSPSPSSPSSSTGSLEHHNDSFVKLETPQDVNFLHVGAGDCSPMTTAEWLDIYQDLDSDMADSSSLCSAPLTSKKRRIDSVEDTEENMNSKRSYCVF